jgi:hypothetical protein
MERCPTCILPLHRLPCEKGFWTIIEELVGPPPERANEVRGFTMAAVEFFFTAHPHWRRPLTWSWLSILLDVKAQPSDFQWRVWAHDGVVFFALKDPSP